MPSDSSEVETKFISVRVLWLMIKKKAIPGEVQMSEKIMLHHENSGGEISSRMANSAARKKVSFPHVAFPVDE